MSIWWKRILVACVAVAALASCTDKMGGKPGAGGPPGTSTLTPDSKRDSALALNDGIVSCRSGSPIQLKLEGSTIGPAGNIIEASLEKDHLRIEWNGETTHVLIVNDKKWVLLDGTSGVTLLYKDIWGTIDNAVLCPKAR